ncbi:AAA family ATPase [Sorangium sp. So ce327]|uniref:AAA family ATPase n=1 Tax=unclassified Sorangium TaxID=2621164 RepID=UPI003F5F74E2
MGSPAVILFVGLPASGKTTFFRTHFSGTHVHVSKDNFPNAKKRDVRQARLVTELYYMTMTNDGFAQEVWQEQSNEE